MHNTVRVAAAISLRGQLVGPTHEFHIVARSARALYLQSSGGAIISVEHAGGSRLPLSLCVDLRSIPHQVRGGWIGGGALTLGPVRLVPSRWWEVTVPSGPVPTAAVSELDDRLSGLSVLSFHREHPVPVGRGEGSTPAGDDWLAGRLLALRVLGADQQANQLWSLIQPHLPSTTPLSAALLRHAYRGEAGMPVVELIRTLLRGTDLALSLRRVCQMGSTSGYWLARGLADELGSPDG